MTTGQRVSAAAIVNACMFLGLAIPYFLLPRIVLLWVAIIIASVWLGPKLARLVTGVPANEFPSRALQIGVIVGLVVVTQVVLHFQVVRPDGAPARGLSEQLALLALDAFGGTLGGFLASYVSVRRAP